MPVRSELHKAALAAQEALRKQREQAPPAEELESSNEDEQVSSNEGDQGIGSDPIGGQEGSDLVQEPGSGGDNGEDDEDELV